MIQNLNVLVPFYRGAVVFKNVSEHNYQNIHSSRPLLSRSGCIFEVVEVVEVVEAFSSPFIEERLYLRGSKSL